MLGPSLIGARIPLPADLHAERLPWSAEPQPVANVELRDQLDTYYPVQQHLVQRLRAGEGAAWIHDLQAGLPGAVFAGWGLWSPFNVPAAFTDFATAWTWSMALRLWAAMAGAYLLTRAAGAGRLGGTVAGIAYGLSGFMVLWLGWPQAHVAAALPWMLWATKRTVARDSPWWAGPALALSTAAVWLGGFPAVSAYGSIAAGIVALHGAWGLRQDRKQALRGLASAALAVSLGLSLAAFTLVPTMRVLEQFNLAYREGAQHTSLPLHAALTFLVPGFFGDVVHHRLWLGVSYVEGVAYTGVTTLVLAAMALVTRPLTGRRPRGPWLWGGLAAGFALLSYGFPPLRWVLGAIPLLRANVPTRALALVCLGLAVLAGLGAHAVERLLRGEARWDGRALRWTAGAGVAAVVAFAVARPPSMLRDLALTRLGPQDAQGAHRAIAVAKAETAVALALVAAAALVLALALRLSRRNSAAASRLLAVGVLGVVSLDLLAFAGGWNVQPPRRTLFPEAPGIDEFQAVSDGHRVAGSDAVLLPNTHLGYGFADARAHAFMTREFSDVLARLNAERPSPTSWDLKAVGSGRWQPWLEMLGVARVLVPDTADLTGGMVPRGRAADLGEPLWDGAVRETTVAASSAGQLEAVLVRLATYARDNRGHLEVTVRQGEATTTGRVPLEALRDLGWNAVPVAPLAVDEDEVLHVRLRATGSSAADAISLMGERHGDVFSPAVGMHYGEELDSRPVGDGGLVRMVELPGALPVVYAVADAEAVRPGAALERVEELGADGLRHTALVEPYRAGERLPRLPSGGTVHLGGWSRQGGEVRARLASQAGAVLVSLDEALDGWRATIDGRPARMVRVNHLFTGVVVPPGAHDVVLRYEPPLAVAAAVASVRAVGALAGWALLRWLRQRTGMSTRQLLITAAHEAQRRWIHRR